MKFNCLILAFFVSLTAPGILAINRPAAYTDIFFRNGTPFTLNINTNVSGKIDSGDMPYAFQRVNSQVAPGQRVHIMRIARGGTSLYKDTDYHFTTDVGGLPGTWVKFNQSVKTTNIAGPAKTSKSCISIQTPTNASACFSEDGASAFTVDKWAVGGKTYTASFAWLAVNDSLYKDIEYSINATGEITAADKLIILQYNIQERPSNEGMNFQVTGQHNERSFLSAVVLPNAIRQFNADVVTFNEAFTARLRPVLMENMTQAGYKYYTDAVGANSSKPWSGGAMVFSKWPIEKKVEYIYQNTAEADASAAKGIWYVQINKMGKIYNIFHTHMNASYSTFVNGRLPNDDKGKAARKLQFKELRSFIDQQNIPANQPVIITGDLNVDMLSERGKPDDEYAYLLSTLDATHPTQTGFGYTYDAKTNQLVEPRDDQSQWLDYAFYSNRHQKPTKSENKSTPLKAPQGTKFGNTDLSGKDLSDHYPILATFEFGGQ